MKELSKSEMNFFCGGSIPKSCEELAKVFDNADEFNTLTDEQAGLQLSIGIRCVNHLCTSNQFTIAVANIYNGYCFPKSIMP